VNPVLRVFLTAVAVVLASNALGALAAARMGFPYAALSPVSFLIYAAAGFAASRTADIKIGVLVASSVALVEATLGWLISWHIGPGRPPDGYQGAGPILGAIVFVTITGAVFGLIGAAVAARFRRRTPPN
jgi:hypothetical protein